MSDQIQQVIKHELAHDFYFIELPENVPEYVWKDRNGKFIFMDNMELDYLKSCISICENAIVRLKESRRRVEVVEALIPRAEEKKKELKESFNQKVNT